MLTLVQELRSNFNAYRDAANSLCRELSRITADAASAAALPYDSVKAVPILLNTELTDPLRVSVSICIDDLAIESAEHWDECDEIIRKHVCDRLSRLNFGMQLKGPFTGEDSPFCLVFEEVKLCGPSR